MKWVDLRCPACNAVSYGPPDSKCKLGHRARAMVKVDRAPAKKLLGPEFGSSPRPAKASARPREEGKTTA